MLSVYERPFDPARTVVCLDETSRQLLADARPVLPPALGRPARRDPEYIRVGVANVFLLTEPLRGWREVLVSAQRTRLDWARCVRHLAGVRYPDAERVVLVMDQLDAHFPASLSSTFPAAAAKRLADRLEVHLTPKSGSWPNLAELELGVFGCQCLGRRLPDRDAVAQEAAAWDARRNGAVSTIRWQFTTADARTNLRRLYPTFEA